MHIGFAINVIQTAKYRKYMHIDFAINVIQTAKNRKYWTLLAYSSKNYTEGVNHFLYIYLLITMIK